ncbi:methyltransferase, FxLD system [Streptomyces avicenniae]|uniref:methyltransferase, FxLD system n=1 Tax=Streptomyces avicenniae TaxID=500153 RepID=UPI00069B57A8|nr:methyltransferase, FxLD system [Streptomyces avicenniae]
MSETSAASAAELRAALVRALREARRITSPQVTEAFAAVPRHVFLPGTGLEDAYRDDAVFTKRAADGRPLSSVSAPWLVATMLERLAPRAGDRVLEVGSGGYNAALLRHVVGSTGSVTSMDIDPDVTGRAEVCLKQAGFSDVRLVTGDGTTGVPDGFPYDRLVVTVQATEIASAWLDQLTGDGRMVVPMRLRGLGRLLTFTRERAGLWRGDGWEQCGFVAMQGPGARDPVATAVLADGVRLRWDGGAAPDPVRLATAFRAEGREVWSGVTVTATEGSRAVLDLWLATTLDAFGRLHTSSSAVPQVLPGGTPATWGPDTLAYLVMRPVHGDATRFEYGVAWHGSDAGVAEAVAEQLRAWDRDHRGGPGPVLYIGAASDDEATCVRRMSERSGPRLVLAWPRSAACSGPRL